MRNKAGIFDVILVEDFNEDLEPTAPKRNLNSCHIHITGRDVRNKHLQRENGCVT